MHAGDVLTHRARLTPHAEALLELEAGRRYDYRELNERACRCANFLVERMGVKAGDRVSILAHNGVAYLDLLYGLAKIGAIFAPLNWRLSAPELEFILRDMEPTVLFVGPEFLSVLDELDEAVPLPLLVLLEGGAASADAPPGALDYDAELARAAAAEPERPALDGETPYCLLYTSGTTGTPKGAILPHRQVLWNCINTVVSWGLRPDDVTPIFTPLFHTGGLFAYLAPIHYAGGRVVLTRSFDAEASLRAIVEERCTVTLGVPTLYRIWTDTPAWTKADFSHVRHFNNGGAACPPELMERWRREKGVVFRQGYGLTEVGPNCFSMTDAQSAEKSGSVGTPILNSAMRLVDPETGREVGADEPGELRISGPHVCAGYWRRPDATAEALVDGWFRTGDTFRRDGDGFYYVIGRYKDMIKSGGENIYAAEVEAVFRRHEAVADAALIGLPDERWGEVGLMVVVPAPGVHCDPDALLAFCQGRIARYKIPRRVVLADALPYSSYGKVLKGELRRHYLESPEGDA